MLQLSGNPCRRATMRTVSVECLQSALLVAHLQFRGHLHQALPMPVSRRVGPRSGPPCFKDRPRLLALCRKPAHTSHLHDTTPAKTSNHAMTHQQLAIFDQWAQANGRAAPVHCAGHQHRARPITEAHRNHKHLDASIACVSKIVSSTEDATTVILELSCEQPRYILQSL